MNNKANAINSGSNSPLCPPNSPLPRAQHTRLKTGAGRKLAASAGAAVLTAALAIAVVWAYFYEPSYQPPPFEANAAQGVPEPAANMRYGVIDAAGRFKFYIAGTMYQQDDGSVKLYFTNDIENEAYLMCEVVDIQNGKTIYRSGLLRPGEYVESLYPLIKLKNEPVRAEIFVYALALDDYMSMGRVSLDNILQPN